MLPNFKSGWCLVKTNKVKPMGYKGFIFTLYDKDDIAVKTEVKSKTASGIWLKIIKLMRKE
jgi:hypothetical protein